jgi:hypothetical protein
MRAPRESDLVRQCLDYLRLRRVPCWRQNVGAARYTNAAGRARLVRYGTPGAADVLGVLPPGGRLLAVECKRDGNPPTDAQRAFLRCVAEAGGLAVVAHGVEDLAEALRRAGL